jgi:hypothetical protein
VIFKSVYCLENGSSAGPSSRTKKTPTRSKVTSDTSEPKLPAKRRAKANAEEVVPAHEEVMVDAEEASTVGHSDSEMIGHEEELVVMNHVQNETQWQQHGEQAFAQNGDQADSQAYAGDEEGFYDDEGYPSQESGQYSQNQIVLTMSYSLMNQVRQTARMEGVLPEDILIELIAEGVTRRAFEDAQRPAPSHLMTRTGYVAPDANGNVQQPQMSHHGMQGNHRGGQNGQNNNRRYNNNQSSNRGNHFQGRNRQNNNFKSKQRNSK